MTKSTYLVAIALINQNNNRLMPLGGKSLKEPLDVNSPGGKSETIALELLIRIIQLTDYAPIARANDEQSLLLLEIEFESMQKKLPLIKEDWIQYREWKG